MQTLPPDLEILQSPPAIVIEAKDKIPALRLQMIKSAACSVGARGGLSFRSDGIRNKLERYSSGMDVLSFQPFMTAEGMLPPVVTEEIDVTRQDSKKVKRLASNIYRIIDSEKLVSIAPTWRDYLYTGLPFLSTVSLPEKAFMPVNDAERSVWKESVRECWIAGEKQANDIFEDNLMKLRRDYYGMIRYQLLFKRGMVNNPQVGTVIRPVTGDGNMLVVDDMEVRVTKPGSMNLDATKWR